MNTHDKTTTRIGLIVLTVLGLWALLANAQFGSFVHDQPFLAASGTNEGNWIWYVDAYDEYAGDDSLNGLDKGTNYLWTVIQPDIVTLDVLQWTNPYVAVVYANTNKYNYLVLVDAMDEYTNNAPLTNLAGGTNWLYEFYSTNTVAQDYIGEYPWTNVYVAKDY